MPTAPDATPPVSASGRDRSLLYIAADLCISNPGPRRSLLAAPNEA